MQSDGELVQAVLDGHCEAFAPLVTRHRRAACAAAARVIGDLHDAEDAAQEAFMVAYQRLGTLRKASAFGSWVVRIAHRQAMDMVRKNKKESSAQLEPGAYHDEHDGRLDEVSQRLLAAVMALPDHERAPVILRSWEDYSLQEIAEMTGCSVGTVSKQLTRAYARLRRQLKDLQP